MELTSLKLETHGEDHGENKDILEWQDLETELVNVEFYLIHHTLLLEKILNINENFIFIIIYKLL